MIRGKDMVCVTWPDGVKWQGVVNDNPPPSDTCIQVFFNEDRGIVTFSRILGSTYWREEEFGEEGIQISVVEGA